MSDLQQYVGSCLCGAVTYQIDGPIGDIIQCHCQKCRKANGTAYATNAPIAKADFKLTSGQDVVKKYASSTCTERCFCGNCGSPLVSIKAETPEFYRLRIGTLDTPLQQKPTQHIFVASQAEWDNICDALPQYAERP